MADAAAREPLFSVVTVTFRNKDGVLATCESLARQSFTDYEWIVIDGGSDDGTVEAVETSGIVRKTLVSERDEGIFDAMNKGIARSQGTYLIFMNAGDAFADSDTLERTAACIGSARPDLVYGDAYEVEGIARFLKPARHPRMANYVMFTHHQAIFYRRDHVRDGYDRSYVLSADWVLTLRLLKRVENVLKLDFPVCLFERGGISQSQSRRRLLDQELWRIYREEIGWSLPSAAALWTLKTQTNRIRRMLPGLYDRIRYKRPTS